MWERLLGAMPVSCRYGIIISLRVARVVSSVVFFTLALGFFAMFCASYIGLEQWGPLLFFRRIGDPAVKHIMRVLPPGMLSIVPLILGLGSLFLRQVADMATHSLATRTSNFIWPRPTSAARTGPAKFKLSDAEAHKARERLFRQYAESASPDNVRFVVTAPQTEQKREELLKHFWEIEHALKASAKKNCTFFSADVVGSTKMKVGQKETDVKATFHAYEQMLKRIFADYGAWKTSWTPDGVMICFLDRELAIGAAKLLLVNLPQFNTNFNKLPEPFRVRCGINEGEVSIYEDSQLERVADRVIDVAGHMQKEAPADSLLLGAHVFDKIEDPSGFKPSGLVIDGYAALEWRVR